MANDDRHLTAALLEIRSFPPQRLQNTPLLFAIGTTLELATLPEVHPAFVNRRVRVVRSGSLTCACT